MRAPILSYHPALEADENLLLTAQRPLDQRDQAAMERAAAILLPQAPRTDLCQLAINSGKPMFPRSRPFHTHDGKLGNLHLFQELNLPHPPTLAFENLAQALAAWRGGQVERAGLRPPLVAKGAGGGEGRNVFLVRTPKDLAGLEGRLDTTCRRGPSGLVLQQYLECGGRDARVVIMGEKRDCFWRVARPGEFRGNLSQGGRVDRSSRPSDLELAAQMADRLHELGGVDLAAVDFLIPEVGKPLFLEINFFFGRRALGGDQAFLHALLRAAHGWLEDLGLEPDRVRLGV